MSKPLNEFGGWLKFFYITLWIGLVLTVFNVLVFLPGFFNGRLSAVYMFLFTIDSGLCAFLGFKIISATKKQEAVTPNRIVRLMVYILLVSLLFAVPEIFFARLVYGKAGVGRIVYSVSRIIIWFCIWTFYLKKSERVLAYYGKPADKFF